MFAIIKNKEITCILWYKPKKGEMPFDEVIEIQDFDSNKFYKFNNWEVIEFIPENTKELTKEEKITQINTETRDKIISRYSETDQVNLQREAQLIISESFLYQITPTEEQMIVLTEAKIAHEYIKACIEEWRQRISLL